jgi:hypothetical protein
MDQHKKILAILYIVTSSLSLVSLLILVSFFQVFLPFILDAVQEESIHQAEVLSWIGPLVNTIVGVVIILIVLPSLIGGIALLHRKPWALTLLLVMGCIKLLSFPIGTALGGYTIWVFIENQNQEKRKENEVI